MRKETDNLRSCALASLKVSMSFEFFILFCVFNKMAKNPKVFFDIAIRQKPIGRITFEVPSRSPFLRLPRLYPSYESYILLIFYIYFNIEIPLSEVVSF